MCTTIDIDNELLKEVMEKSGAKSKKERYSYSNERLSKIKETGGT